jgi:hypothetical protein
VGLSSVAKANSQRLFMPVTHVAVEVQQIHEILLEERLVPGHTACINTCELAKIFSARAVPGNVSDWHLIITSVGQKVSGFRNCLPPDFRVKASAQVVIYSRRHKKQNQQCLSFTNSGE